MSASRVTYVDSSALVKLATREPESRRLSEYLRRKKLVASALVTTEVMRALHPLGVAAMRRGESVLGRLDLVRINQRVLTTAGGLQPATLRTLDAIHLATAQILEDMLSAVVTYDKRMAMAAQSLGLRVASPA